MLTVNPNKLSVPIVFRNELSLGAMQTSMSRMSSGLRLQRPGDGPSEFGIAQLMTYQIRNTLASEAVIQNANNMVASADSWLQSVQNMLSRMAELAVSAVDSSKTDEDRANLDMEFQQLRAEISRIGGEAKYNGVQIAGKNQIVTYDKDRQTFLFSEVDGTDAYHLPGRVLSAVESKNGLPFAFSAANAFSKSQDGRYLYYVDGNNALVRYEIETGILTRDASVSGTTGLDVDNEGRLWYATSTAAGQFALRQQNLTSWERDTTIVPLSGITDMGSKEFRVYEDRVYYFNTGGELISRSLLDLNEIRVELDSSALSTPLNMTSGNFTISQDGQYVADFTSGNVIRVIHLETGNQASITLDPLVSGTSIAFGSDNREIVWIDSRSNEIQKVDFRANKQPSFGALATIRHADVSGFVGLSLDGGSNRAQFRVHDGPDALQEFFFETGDVRLYTLGISRASVDTLPDAIKAIESTSEAIQKLNLQRSKLSAQTVRLQSTLHSLTEYREQIGMARSQLRDVDFAEESALLARSQMLYNAQLALMAQANRTPQALLGLLRRG